MLRPVLIPTLVLLLGMTVMDAAAFNPTAAAPAAWSMVLDTSMASYPRDLSKLRRSLRTCTKGRALVYHDVGVTRLDIDGRRAGSCRLTYHVEIEGQKRLYRCESPLDAIDALPVPKDLSKSHAETLGCTWPPTMGLPSGRENP